MVQSTQSSVSFSSVRLSMKKAPCFADVAVISRCLQLRARKFKEKHNRTDYFLLMPEVSQ